MPTPGSPREKCFLEPHRSEQQIGKIATYRLFLSTGGRYVKVWDMLKGGQLLVSLKNHHKMVTCLCLSSSGQRLLSDSLDRKVKIYSTTSYKVVHSFDYAASVLSLALSHQDETVVVGMTNGILSIKHRKSEAKKESLPRRRRPAYRTFIKGKIYTKQRVIMCFFKSFLKCDIS